MCDCERECVKLSVFLLPACGYGELHSMWIFEDTWSDGGMLVAAS